MKQSFSSPGFLWPLLTLICLVIILSGLKTILKKTGWEKSRALKIFLAVLAVTTAWVAILTVLAQRGFFSDFSKLPRPALAILVPLITVLFISFSTTGTKLIKLVPPQWFVFMQIFRILVELLIWFAFLANKLPEQMTIEGRNFDVFTGLLALPVGYLLLKRKEYSPKVAITFNIAGILLLINVVIIAVLSMPTPFRQFMNEPSGELIGSFPFILLPGILVPIAFSMHIFSLRQLVATHAEVFVKTAKK